MYDVIGLSDWCGEILGHSSLQHCISWLRFVGIYAHWILLRSGMRSFCWYAQFGFPKRATLYHGQTSPLWSCLSNGHCSRSLTINERCRDGDIALGLCFKFCWNCCNLNTDLEVNLLICELLERLANVFIVFHLSIIFFTAE